MSCTFDQELLTGYYDGALDAQERESVDRHIATCSDCLRQLEEIKGVVTQLKALPRLQAPVAIRAGVQREIATVRPASFRRILLHFSAAAAAAVLVVITISIASAPRVEEAARGVNELAVKTASTPARTPMPSSLPAAQSEGELGRGFRAANRDEEKKHGDDRHALQPAEEPVVHGMDREKEEQENLHRLSAATKEAQKRSEERKDDTDRAVKVIADESAALSVLRFRTTDPGKAREAAEDFIARLSLAAPAPPTGEAGRGSAGTATLIVELTDDEAAQLQARIAELKPAPPALSLMAKSQESRPQADPAPAKPQASPAPKAAAAPERETAASRGRSGAKASPTPSGTPEATPDKTKKSLSEAPGDADGKLKEDTQASPGAAGDDTASKGMKDKLEGRQGELREAPHRKRYILLFEPIDPAPPPSPTPTK